MVLHGQAEDEVLLLRKPQMFHDGIEMLLIRHIGADTLVGIAGGIQRVEGVKSLHAQVVVAVVEYAHMPVQGGGVVALIGQDVRCAADGRQSDGIGIQCVFAAQGAEHLKFALAGTAASFGHIDQPPAAFLHQGVIVGHQGLGQVQVLAQNGLIGEGFRQHQNDVGLHRSRVFLRQGFHQLRVDRFHVLLLIIDVHQGGAVLIHGDQGEQAAVLFGVLIHIGGIVAAEQGKLADAHQPDHQKAAQHRQDPVAAHSLALFPDEPYQHGDQSGNGQPDHRPVDAKAQGGYFHSIPDLGHIGQQDRLQPEEQLVVVHRAVHRAQATQPPQPQVVAPGAFAQGRQGAQSRQQSVGKQHRQGIADHPPESGKGVHPGKAFQT